MKINIFSVKFFFFIATFWSATAFALFLYGLQYDHPHVALIRNIYSPVLGAILSIILALLLSQIVQFTRLVRMGIFLCVILALSAIMVGVLNPITYGLLGAGSQNYSAALIFKDILYFVLIFLIWTFLYMEIFKIPAPWARVAEIEEEPNSIVVTSGEKLVKLILDEVAAITANGDYVNYVTANKSYLVKKRLQSCEDELEGRGFVRIHRSALVQKNHVCEVVSLGKGQYEVTLTGGVKVKSSRSYKECMLTLLPDTR